MAASSSQLDTRHDLVCAVTQDAINATLKEFLAGYQGEQFTACYRSDAAAGTVEVPLEELRWQTSGDPFALADNCAADDPLLLALHDAQFAYAFRATMGLPAAMPDIVTLDRGDSKVSYQLSCAEFCILTLTMRDGRPHFRKLEQSGDAPWIFRFEVDLALRSGGHDHPDAMFSVQQLYLDLNTASLQSMPAIVGLAPDSAAHAALSHSFLRQYWHSLPGNGVLLAYAPPPAATQMRPSLVPAGMAIQVSPHLDADGQPSGLYGLYTLNYLVTASHAALPPRAPFSWNWLEQDDAADFSGTMALRRDVFAAVLVDWLAPSATALSIDSAIWMTHAGEVFHTVLSAPQSHQPAAWTLLPSGLPADVDGYIPLLAIAYANQSDDASVSASRLSSISGAFNYSMNGQLSVRGGAMRLTLRAKAHVEFQARIVGIQTAQAAAEIVDYTAVADYMLGVDGDGRLTATLSEPRLADRGADVPTSRWGYLIGLTDLSAVTGRLRASLSIAAAHAMRSLTGPFVYPGAPTFCFKRAQFSEHQDLLAHLTYIAPGAAPTPPVPHDQPEKNDARLPA